MKPLRLIHINNIEYKHEIFLRQEPPVLKLFIYILTTLILIAFLYCTFGKMEDVVKAKGSIRPLKNVSIVKSISEGEIIKINYTADAFVKKNDILLKTDDSVYLAEQKALTFTYKQTNHKFAGMTKIIESYYANKNLVPAENKEAFARFSVYENESTILEKKRDMLKIILDEAQQLPKSAVTPVKIREMKYNLDMAELDLLTYKHKFINTVIAEKKQLFIHLEDLKRQLKKNEIALKNTVLRSPITGYVQELSSLNEGDYINYGQNILNIIPDTFETYKVEISVLGKDVGKITEDMLVKYRFSAFPFHEFGGAQGKITAIDPDSSISKYGTVYFSVVGSIDKTQLFDKQGLAYAIKPGFEVDARIVLHERPIIWYFLRTMGLAW